MDSLIFHYEKEYYMFRNVGSRSYESNSYGCPTEVEYYSQVYQVGGILTNSDNQMVTEVEGLRLKEIEGNRLSVEFVSDSLRIDVDRWSTPKVIMNSNIGGWFNNPPKWLNDIILKDNNGLILKKYAIGCDYFSTLYSPNEFPGDGSQDVSIPNGNFGMPDEYRLRLRYFAQLSNDSQDSLKHNFSYYEEDFPEHGVNTSLPRRKCFAQDDYGYFNGAYYNEDLMPSVLVDDQHNGGFKECSSQTDRSADYPSMQVGTLAKIEYPTGGSTSFEFEPHQVDQTTLIQDDIVYFVAGSGINCSDAGIPSVSLVYPEHFNHFSQDDNGYLKVQLSSASTIDPQEWSSSAAQLWGLCLTKDDGTTHDITSLFNQTPYAQACPNQVVCGVEILLMELEGYPYYISNGETFTISAYIDQSLEQHVTLTVTGETFKESNENIIVGGLRISKIINDDGHGNSVIKNYGYNTSDFGTSSGVLVGKKVYGRKIIGPEASYLTGYEGSSSAACVTPNCVNQDYLFSDNSVVPLESTTGSHIGYLKVEEFQTGNGKIVSQFFVTPNNGVGLAEFPIPTWEQSNLLNGKLEKEEIYDDQGIKVSERNFIYDFNLTHSEPVQTIRPGVTNPCILGDLQTSQTVAYNIYEVIEGQFSGCLGVGGGYQYYHENFLFVENYNIVTGYVTLREESTLLNGVRTTTNYSYDPLLRHGNAISKSFVNSDGITRIEKIVYSHELEITNIPWHWQEEALEFMQDLGINQPIEVSTWIHKPGKAERCLSSTLSLYDKNNFDKVNLARIWSTEFISPSTTFEQVKISSTGGFLVKDPAYHTANENLPSIHLHYNDYGNIYEQNPAFDENSSLIWDNSNHHALAKILNGRAYESAYTSFENGDNEGGWIFNSTTAQSQFLGKKCKQLSSGSISKPSVYDGAFVISFWAKSGEVNINVDHQIVETIMAEGKWKKFTVHLDIPHVQGSSVPVSLSGTAYIDELRFHREDARMITYGYEGPNVAVVLDQTNQIESQYEYDAFRRLELIRDKDNNILVEHDYVYDPDNALSSIISRSVKVKGIKNQQDLETLDENESTVNVNYVDGLGRSIQRIVVKGTASKKDALVFTEYDNLGRITKQHRPMALASNNGTYRADAKWIHNVLYGADGYEELEFEKSPLNRIKKVSAMGSDWSLGTGHEVRKYHRANFSNEVRLFDHVGMSSGFYDPSVLNVEQTLDENGHSVIVYRDRNGKEIMNNKEGYQTYFVYDDFGRLKYVIPPKVYEEMENSGLFNCQLPNIKQGLFILYYDFHGQIIRKDIPGKNEERVYYDRLGRIVLNEDANGVKTFTKYDILGRPIMTGLYTGNQLPTNTDGLYETPSEYTAHGYTESNSFPTYALDITSITYYDHHDFNRDGILDASETFVPSADVLYNDLPRNDHTGFVTGSKLAVFDDNGKIDKYLFTRTYFSDDNHEILTISDNVTGEEDLVYKKHDFTGKVINEKILHRANFGVLSATIIDKEYHYDHMGRITKTYHEINGSGKELVSKLSYNDKNEISSKSLGATDLAESKFLQVVNYSYDIHGRIIAINNVDDCGVDVQKNKIGTSGKQNGRALAAKNTDIFSMKFYYNVEKPNLSIEPQYNGNINAIEYRDGCGNNKKGFGFEYDNHGRLIEALYAESDPTGQFVQNNMYDVSNISYDENGNITGLIRNGLSGLNMDHLAYSVDLDNQLDFVEETGDPVNGFRQVNSDGSYFYDNAGNMIRDNGKEMDVIYNTKNLPEIIAFDNLDSIKHSYDASGSRYASETKGHNESSWTRKTYIGEFEYNEGQLEAVYFGSGRAVPSQGQFRYEYSIKDHLGNTRATFSDLNDDGKITESDGEVLQRNHFYPFGMEMEGSWGSVVGAENQYKYNGKELHSDFGLNWYDYGARWYEPALGRWHSPDPLADNFVSLSPYNYSYNDPIKYFDPDGASPDKCCNGNAPQHQNWNQYTIKKGESLSAIAKREYTTTEAILRWNPQISDENKIYAGETLNLPMSDGNAPQDAKTQEGIPLSFSWSLGSEDNVVSDLATGMYVAPLPEFVDAPVPDEELPEGTITENLVIVDLGIQGTVKPFGVLGVDANIVSYEVFTYDFNTNSGDWGGNVKHSMGVSALKGGAGIELTHVLDGAHIVNSEFEAEAYFSLGELVDVKFKGKWNLADFSDALEIDGVQYLMVETSKKVALVVGLEVKKVH
ncbi:MAG: DUF6443 domain-containing protein, partial [Flavobacteriales bacterium]|nr:DUF6443 domain-containing protein [Flavobacteriales bacterium]